MIRKPEGWIADCEYCWRELRSDDIYDCHPQDEDEFVEVLKNDASTGRTHHTWTTEAGESRFAMSGLITFSLSVIGP